MTVFVPEAAGQHYDFPTELSGQIKESNKAALTNVFECLQKNTSYNKWQQPVVGQHIKDNLALQISVSV